MRKHQHEPKITKLRDEANKLLQHMKPIVLHALETGSQVVFENPGGSALWASNGFRSIIAAAKKLGRPLRRIDHDQCMFAEDGAEPRDVYKKATAFFTTMPRAWTAHLEKRCTHGRGAHKPCVGWRTKGVSNAAHSAAYPKKLCKAWARAVEMAKVHGPAGPADADHTATAATADPSEESGERDKLDDG